LAFLSLGLFKSHTKVLYSSEPLQKLMQATLHHPINASNCAPITHGRLLGDCLVANHKLKELITTELSQAGFDMVPNARATVRTVHLPMDHWIEVGALCLLARSETPSCLRDKRGDLVAWKGADTADACVGDMVTQAECFRIQYPWNLLELNEEVLSLIDTSEIAGEISPLAQVDGYLHLGRGSVLLPGVYIEGNVIIGKNCRIGPNSYIRGNTAIGDDCTIGNAVEVKNSVIYPHTNIKHLSYVGDSIIGSHVHLGAGTILANYRHDGTNHRSNIGGRLIDTERIKYGAVVGDGVRTGVNTCVYPGRKIGPGRMTLPNAVVDKDLMHNGSGAGNPGGYQS
jgi:acetyltransferase-like isoleucine patch superfamily enzyme